MQGRKRHFHHPFPGKGWCEHFQIFVSTIFNFYHLIKASGPTIVLSEVAWHGLYPATTCMHTSTAKAHHIANRMLIVFRVLAP